MSEHIGVRPYRCQSISVSEHIGVSKQEANSVQIACERLLANEKDLAQRYQYIQHSNVVIMVFTSSQRAALRAKKALANGNINFKPRGIANKAVFEALKKQAREAQTNSNASNSACETPLQRRTKYKRIKFTVAELNAPETKVKLGALVLSQILIIL